MRKIENLKKLLDLAEVSTGIVLNRIEDKIGENYRIFQYIAGESSTYEIKSTKKISENYILQKNDIVFKTVYPFQAILVSEENIGNILSSNFAKIRIKSSMITPEFLVCFLNSKLAEKSYSKLIVGSVIKKISIQEFKEILIPIPNLEKQRKIFELNKKLSEKIFQLQKLANLTEELQNFYISELLK